MTGFEKKKSNTKEDPKCIVIARVFVDVIFF
jgi:hypothetical protein